MPSKSEPMPDVIDARDLHHVVDVVDQIAERRTRQLLLQHGFGLVQLLRHLGCALAHEERLHLLVIRIFFVSQLLGLVTHFCEMNPQ